jgi:hypothetical protein
MFSSKTQDSKEIFNSNFIFSIGHSDRAISAYQASVNAIPDNVYYGQREKILNKCEELKQKTVFERKQYNSKITIRVEIAL